MIKFKNLLAQRDVVEIQLHSFEQYLYMRNKLNNLGYTTLWSETEEQEAFVEDNNTLLTVRTKHWKQDMIFFLYDSTIVDDPNLIVDFHDIDFEENKSPDVVKEELTIRYPNYEWSYTTDDIGSTTGVVGILIDPNKPRKAIKLKPVERID